MLLSAGGLQEELVSGIMKVAEIGTEHSNGIHSVVSAAFGRPDEADLVRQLRDDGDVVLELAAFEDGTILGHILFSALAVAPATIRIASLAPVSVLPARQNQGIGSALIREGLARCGRLGFDACAVLGEPDYYKRFGFGLDTARALQSVYSGHAYQAMEFKPGALAGGDWRITYPKAFG
jgi:putative acetyltransferase